MKIIDAPQYGPMFRFTDASVYWALHILSDGKRMGRKRLSEEIGVGEGSMRTFLAICFRYKYSKRWQWFVSLIL